MARADVALEAALLIDRLDRIARSGEAKGGLNPAQWEALRFIARANRFSRTPAGVAEYLGSTRGTVSQTLITLEEKGHITREPSARDGRSVTLALTARGRELLRSDPMLALATDLASVDPALLEAVTGTLRVALQTMLARNGRRAFGACFTCRQFREGGGPSAAMPHYCALLQEPLSETDSQAICIEQEPAARMPS
jgi:DNA-binding MarR family transcriptional regulator